MQRLLDACLFAARAHSGQCRKGAAREPYVNHVIDVAARLAASPLADEDTVVAGLLHDTVEDTPTTEAELAARFGPRVAGMVMEVTDDKSLDRPIRKALQVAHIGSRSIPARRIKIADQTSNLAALAESPPADWDRARAQEYLDWAVRVVAAARGVDPGLEAAFDAQASATAAVVAGMDAGPGQG